MKKKKVFINVADYFRAGIYYYAFVGGRGGGKTFSTLEYCVGKGEKYIYMRRTLDELVECCDHPTHGELENPFKGLNKERGSNWGIVKVTKKSGAIFDRVKKDDGTFEYVGEATGYALALSAIATMRGIDLSDAGTLFYDEFIPEKHVRKIKAEGEAFLNAIETIARNREMMGIEPMRVIMCANAFDIYNEIFMELGVVGQVEKMINRGQTVSYFQDRGLCIAILPHTEEFIEKKQKTSLYKLTAGTRFYDMALNNAFVYNDFTLIGYRYIKGMRPVVGFDNCYVYESKGDNQYYISYAKARCPYYNTRHIQDKKAFFDAYGKWLRMEFIESHVSFETYDIKMKFLDAIGIT